ncbi:hypothetical protein ACWA1C_12410 [Flectobacillus roseus]
MRQQPVEFDRQIEYGCCLRKFVGENSNKGENTKNYCPRWSYLQRETRQQSVEFDRHIEYGCCLRKFVGENSNKGETSGI